MNRDYLSRIMTKDVKEIDLKSTWSTGYLDFLFDITNTLSYNQVRKAS